MNQFLTRQRPDDISGRLQWARLALAVALAVLGMAIMTHARAPALVLAWLGAISLIVAGLAQHAAREETPVWLDSFPGLALMAGALAFIWWNAAFVMLPQLITAAILARALVALVRSASLAERCAAVFSASLAVIYGSVVLIWPLLAPFVFVFLFACWLVFAGLADVMHVLRVRFRKAAVTASASPSVSRGGGEGPPRAQ